MIKNQIKFILLLSIFFLQLSLPAYSMEDNDEGEYLYTDFKPLVVSIKPQEHTEETALKQDEGDPVVLGIHLWWDEMKYGPIYNDPYHITTFTKNIHVDFGIKKPKLTKVSLKEFLGSRCTKAERIELSGKPLFEHIEAIFSMSNNETCEQIKQYKHGNIIKYKVGTIIFENISENSHLTLMKNALTKLKEEKYLYNSDNEDVILYSFSPNSEMQKKADEVIENLKKHPRDASLVN